MMMKTKRMMVIIITIIILMIMIMIIIIIIIITIMVAIIEDKYNDYNVYNVEHKSQDDYNVVDESNTAEKTDSYSLYHYTRVRCQTVVS